MKINSAFLLFFLFCLDHLQIVAQNKLSPTAKFTFNNQIAIDEVSKHKVKFSGVSFTEDRFGNDRNAIYVYGNEFSYANLGNYPALKPKEGTISLWVKIQVGVWTGSGYKANPILLTKCCHRDDFFEAYGIYFEIESKKFSASSSKDSLQQVRMFTNKEVNLTQWHHLVLSYDYKVMQFYLDGVLQRTSIKNYETDFLASDSVIIGVSANKKNSRYMEGAVDDIEIYDRVLTASEIQELYRAPNPNSFTLLLQRIGYALLVLLSAFILYLIVRFQLNRKMKRERERLELNTKLLETELRVNRALMNPHFIFNSLNAIQNLILNSKNDLANTYLIKFSKLIRKILESNTSESISLAMEIDILNRYLEIEELRFEKNFLHNVEVDADLQPAQIKIPIMMIQPFVENAIWHGLMRKKGDKMIHIHFSSYEENYLLCTIDDNGTGRIEEPESAEKKSLATVFVKSRLELMNKIHNLNCSLEIIDKPDKGGTRIQLILPQLNTLKS